MNDDLGEKLLDNGFVPFEIDKLDKESILDEDIFKYVLAIQDNITKTRIMIDLQEKAKKLKVSRSFDKLFKAYQTNYVQQIKQQGSRTIEFTNCPLQNLKCGKWECKDTGVSKTVLNNFDAQVIVACPHPILPIERLINIEDQTEKVKLAFFKDNKWQNVIVQKGVISNNAQITQLANRRNRGKLQYSQRTC